jgi:hypothetical protein
MLVIWSTLVVGIGSRTGVSQKCQSRLLRIVLRKEI